MSPLGSETGLIRVLQLPEVCDELRPFSRCHQPDRHERASTVPTSNKGFEEWGGVLGDEVMAAALIDRLLHHCHIVNVRGNSYRMRNHQDLLRSEEPREGAAA